MPNSKKHQNVRNNFAQFEKKEYCSDMVSKWIKDAGALGDVYTYGGAANDSKPKKSGQQFVIKIVIIKARIVKEPCCGAMHVES